MIHKGDRIYWKVVGFPDASGVAMRDEDEQGMVLIDTSEPGQEGGAIYKHTSELTGNGGAT